MKRNAPRPPRVAKLCQRGTKARENHIVVPRNLAKLKLLPQRQQVLTGRIVTEETDAPLRAQLTGFETARCSKFRNDSPVVVVASTYRGSRQTKYTPGTRRMNTIFRHTFRKITTFVPSILSELLLRQEVASLKPKLGRRRTQAHTYFVFYPRALNVRGGLSAHRTPGQRLLPRMPNS